MAIQLGTDQLQGAPSELFSSFIFWYFMAETIPDVVLQWVFYFFSFIDQASVPLYRSLLIAVFVSVVLAVKNCFMSKWFVREIAKSAATDANRDHRSDISNPYHLIFQVLKFAKEHKCPVQRSALTYWEDKIPSRIDLGKRKYGGPFTTEEVENVKTFLQLLKLLLSLSGILVTSYLIRINSFENLIDDISESYNSHVYLVDTIYLIN